MFSIPEVYMKWEGEMKKRRVFARLTACFVSALMVVALLPVTALAAKYEIYFNCTGGGFNIPYLHTGFTDDNGRVDELTMQRTPTLEGFTFNGWYDAPNGGNEIKAGRQFSKNTTIYAHWTRGSKSREFVQVAGNDRFETANEIARKTYNGQKELVIVNGFKFPDALAANAYAGAFDGIILLSRTTDLPYQVQNLLTGEFNGKFDKVTLIGGEFQQQVKDNLIDCKFSSSQINTLAGKDRYQTAEILCQEMINQGKAGDTVAVATGVKSADSISFSPWSYGRRIPILLAHGNGEVDATTKALIGKFKNVIILGGDLAVKSSCATSSQNVVRLGGNDRYETSVKIAKHFMEGPNSPDEYWLPYDGTCIADGTGGNSANDKNGHFPDALAGGQFAAAKGSPIILVQEGKTGNASMTFIKERGSGTHSTANSFYFLGYAGKSNSFVEVLSIITS